MNNSATSKVKIPPKTDFRKTTLLLIEDNPDHLFLIKSTLDECMPGVNAIGVENGKEALKYLADQENSLAHQTPKLILADLYLPSREAGLLALQTIKEFFKAKKSPPIPIVMFSYSDQDSDIKDCYARGANAYVVKSPDYQEWADYFTNLREFWLETVSLPQRG
ncbi:response regulator [Persicitalea jodogahamensis]|uniref:Response regulator n=1 Tax=Persicitalea jodogahamensis TaxID=402147 RepID=A0A8J3D7J4_9BACT|nr:response regulator [Persicitalea jodogahamensis]GHB64494.1 response regulator [Persicitalea jodogahamensis]